MDTEHLLTKHHALWRGVLDHDFIRAVRDGNLPEESFESWLVQDYHFVVGQFEYQSRLVPRAPRQDQRLLVGGLIALEEEIAWFEDHMSSRNLIATDSLHPDNVAYRRFLQDLEREHYVTNIVALWALEEAYLRAWSSAGDEIAPEYREFVEHWTTREFSGYVEELRRAADDALLNADERLAHRAEAAFLAILKLERLFWSIAYSRLTV